MISIVSSSLKQVDRIEELSHKPPGYAEFALFVRKLQRMMHYERLDASGKLHSCTMHLSKVYPPTHTPTHPYPPLPTPTYTHTPTHPHTCRRRRPKARMLLTHAHPESLPRTHPLLAREAFDDIPALGSAPGQPRRHIHGRRQAHLHVLRSHARGAWVHPRWWVGGSILVHVRRWVGGSSLVHPRRWVGGPGLVHLRRWVGESGLVHLRRWIGGSCLVHLRRWVGVYGLVHLRRFVRVSSVVHLRRWVGGIWSSSPTTVGWGSILVHLRRRVGGSSLVHLRRWVEGSGLLHLRR